MWNLVKFVFSVIWLFFCLIVGVVGFIWLGLQRLVVERPIERKEQELLQREEEVLAAEARRNLRGPNPDIAVLESEIVRLIALRPLPTWQDFLDAIVDRYRMECQKLGYIATCDAQIKILGAVIQLYIDERLNEPPSRHLISGLIELGQYHDELIKFANKITDATKLLDLITRKLVGSAIAFTRHLPAFAREPLLDEASAPAKGTTIAFVDAIDNLPKVIEDILAPLLDTETESSNLFVEFRKKYNANVEETKHARTDHRPTPREGVTRVLKDTPFAKCLLEARLPYQIRQEDRGEHTAIVAGSGWGKTQLLQSIIASDLLLDDPPGMVIVDSTGAIVEHIQRLALFNDRLRDRLLIIDPTHDVPALNMFDISAALARATTDIQREAIESEIIGLFNYVFSSLDNPLTAQQATPFAFIIRLLITMPGANLDTLQQLLEDSPRDGYSGAISKFRNAIERLDDTTQHFFKTQYYGRTSDARRDQIAQRVLAVMKVPAFRRMFSTVNKVDFFTELNRGTIVVVNTSENLLKESSATFGRYIISRCMAAAFEREPIPRDQRRQAFLIVDEAAPYFDEQFEKLLTRVRQFKLGVVIAFQHLEQASQALRSAIASSTAVKYSGGVGYADARWLANEMRVDHTFIQAQKRDSNRPPQWSEFACYVRNFTDRAVSLTIPFYQLENMPKMNDEQHRELLQRNRERVSYTTPVPMPRDQQQPVIDSALLYTPLDDEAGELSKDSY